MYKSKHKIIFIVIFIIWSGASRCDYLWGRLHDPQVAANSAVPVP